MYWALKLGAGGLVVAMAGTCWLCWRLARDDMLNVEVGFNGR